jgi:hypothetical protein
VTSKVGNTISLNRWLPAVVSREVLEDVMRTLISAFALLLLLGSASAGEIYHWVDENGTHHYSNSTVPNGAKAETLDDEPGKGGSYTQIKEPKLPAQRYPKELIREFEYDKKLFGDKIKYIDNKISDMKTEKSQYISKKAITAMDRAIKELEGAKEFFKKLPPLYEDAIGRMYRNGVTQNFALDFKYKVKEYLRNSDDLIESANHYMKEAQRIERLKRITY